MSVFRTVIGTVTIAEELERTQYHQRACDYTNHLVKPGEYEVTCSWERFPNGMVSAKDVYVTCDSVIVEQYMPDLFCGNVLSNSNATPDTTRKPGQYHAHLYAYQFPAELAEGAREVELLGGVFRPATGVQFEIKNYGSEPSSKPRFVEPVHIEPATV